eukprot:557674-Hanusia_phi.AAC.1
MTFLSSGNVGIGKTNPAYKLDVTGDIGFSGTLQSGTVPVARVSGLSTVATSGSYNDLSNTPTLFTSANQYITAVSSDFSVSSQTLSLASQVSIDTLYNRGYNAQWTISGGGT